MITLETPIAARDRLARIRAEQIATLYRHAPLAILGSVVVAVLLVGAVWGAVPPLRAMAWLVAMAALSAGRAGLVLAYRRTAPAPAQAERWGRRYLAGAVASGCLWGAGGVVSFVPGSLESQLIVAFLLAGMCTGAVTSLGASLAAFYGFSLPTMLPYAAVSLAQGDHLHVTVALAIAVWVAALSFFARNLNHTLIESLALRFENLDLVAELTVQKEEAERANTAKSRFLAAASHDLRQPLHAVALFVAALTDRLGQHEARPIVDKITASVEALDGLFNALLDISKLDAGIVQPQVRDFPLQPLLDRLDRDFAAEAAEKGLRFRLVPTRAILRSDPTLIERILRNLVSNAIRYTPAGGVLVACRRRPGGLRLEVRDTGIGIAPDQLGRVFDEFYQVGNPERDRRRGLGLGLAIVDRLARLLDHPVRVVSAPGRGSVFSVTVPRGEAALADEDLPGPADVVGGNLAGAVVVVVDDERAVLEGMREVLQGWGCRPLLAGSAAEALAQLPDAGRRPAAIIADYRLRAGETGAEAIERIKAVCGSGIPGVLITGDTASDRLREAEASGYHLLHKPVRPVRLRALLSFLLSAPEPQPPV